MKKLIIITLCSLLLVGCGMKVALDLNKVRENVSTIEIDGEKVFGDCVNFDKETLKAKYNLDVTYMTETLIMMPMKVNNSNMYMIVKAENGHIGDVKKELDKIMVSYENTWGMGYAPKEDEKVHNRLEEIKNDYLIYVISPDNDLVLKTILESK